MPNNVDNVSVYCKFIDGKPRYFKKVGSIKTMSGVRFGYEKEISSKAYYKLYNELYPTAPQLVLSDVISKTQAGQLKRKER